MNYRRAGSGVPKGLVVGVSAILVMTLLMIGYVWYTYVPSSPNSSSYSSAIGVLGVPTRTITQETTYDTTTFSNSSTSVITIVNAGTTSNPPTNPFAPCVIGGQPAGIYLRIISDSSLTPVVGVRVTAVHYEAGDDCNGVPHAGGITISSFQTDGSLWYGLDNSNAGTYSFMAEYSGHSYNFTSGEMKPVSVTCETLYLPSGRTGSSTTYMQTSCG